MKEIKCSNCLNMLDIVAESVAPCSHCKKEFYLQGYSDAYKDILAKIDILIQKDIKHRELNKTLQ